jgi:hypothetical protein
MQDLAAAEEMPFDGINSTIPKWKVSEHDFFHVCGINSWLHTNNFLFLKY